MMYTIENQSTANKANKVKKWKRSLNGQVDQYIYNMKAELRETFCYHKNICRL